MHTVLETPALMPPTAKRPETNTTHADPQLARLRPLHWERVQTTLTDVLEGMWKILIAQHVVDRRRTTNKRKHRAPRVDLDDTPRGFVLQHRSLLCGLHTIRSVLHKQGTSSTEGHQVSKRRRMCLLLNRRNAHGSDLTVGPTTECLHCNLVRPVRPPAHQHAVRGRDKVATVCRGTLHILQCTAKLIRECNHACTASSRSSHWTDSHGRTLASAARNCSSMRNVCGEHGVEIGRDFISCTRSTSWVLLQDREHVLDLLQKRGVSMASPSGAWVGMSC